MHYTHRPLTKDYRFSLPMLLEHLNWGSNPHLSALRPMVLQAGAQHIGKARVGRHDGTSVMKDSVYSVQNMDEFLSKLDDLRTQKPEYQSVTVRCPCCDAKLAISMSSVGRTPH